MSHHLAKAASHVLRGPTNTRAMPPSCSPKLIKGRLIHTQITHRTNLISGPISKPLSLSQPRAQHRPFPRTQQVGLATSRDNPPPSEKPSADEAANPHQQTPEEKTETPPQPPPPSPEEDSDPKAPKPAEPTFYWDGEPIYPPGPIVWLWRLPRTYSFWAVIMTIYFSDRKEKKEGIDA